MLSGLLASPVAVSTSDAADMVQELVRTSKQMEHVLRCRDWPCIRLVVTDLCNKVGDDEGIVLVCGVYSMLKAVRIGVNSRLGTCGGSNPGVHAE